MFYARSVFSRRLQNGQALRRHSHVNRYLLSSWRCDARQWHTLLHPQRPPQFSLCSDECQWQHRRSNALLRFWRHIAYLWQYAYRSFVHGSAAVVGFGHLSIWRTLLLPQAGPFPECRPVHPHTVQPTKPESVQLRIEQSAHVY
jgi:hypothetical protein